MQGNPAHLGLLEGMHVLGYNRVSLRQKLRDKSSYRGLRQQ